MELEQILSRMMVYMPGQEDNNFLLYVPLITAFEEYFVCRFFTHYTGKGRYNVKCQVVGDDDTKVNEGFINSKDGRSIPMAPGGTPMCCGSDTITPDSVLSKSGNFTRSAAGGAFQV